MLKTSKKKWDYFLVEKAFQIRNHEELKSFFKSKKKFDTNIDFFPK